MNEKSWEWDGAVAVVTGAAQGMGFACAIELARLGASVVLFDRNPQIHDRLQSLPLDDDRRLALEGDVGSQEDWKRLVDEAMKRFDRVDLLVNAAGVLRPTSLLAIEESEWEWVLRVNLTGAFLGTQAVGRIMKEQRRGRIVHFSSTAGKTVSTIGGAHYTASKHGVLGLTRASAKELAPFGVTVNAVCPGLIDTEMVLGTIDEESVARYAESFPVGRLGRPEEVAKLVVFLAESPYITGAAVDVNGGDLMV